MEKISWVNTKNLNIQKINIKINDCIETKHFTNNGKNVVQLNKKIHSLSGGSATGEQEKEED